MDLNRFHRIVLQQQQQQQQQRQNRNTIKFFYLIKFM